MTMVSRFRLKPEVWDKIFNLFSESLLSINNKNKYDAFLNEFLSPTEKIMLSKRFAIAILLSKGNSYSDIKRVLRVTSSTIAKMNVYIKYNGKGINEIVGNVLRKDAGRLICEEIQSLFDLPKKGLPISEYHKKIIKRNRKISQLKHGI